MSIQQLSAVYRASKRQQDRIRSENCRRSTFDDVMAALDLSHEGRIEASPGTVRQWTVDEWAQEVERRNIEDQINRGIA